jgi:hypothetical protein
MSRIAALGLICLLLMAEAGFGCKKKASESALAIPSKYFQTPF